MRLNMLFYKCFVCHCFVELSDPVHIVPIDVLAYNSLMNLWNLIDVQE